LGGYIRTQQWEISAEMKTVKKKKKENSRNEK
jgi:hypothetical protein